MSDVRQWVRGARLIDPGQDRDGAFDLVVDAQGRVVAVEAAGAQEPPADCELIDGSGLWLLPGLVDLHTHLREPGQEYKETIASGAAAAVQGGFTTICCMANTDPVNDTGSLTRFIAERGRDAGKARVRPIGALSKGLAGKRLAEMVDMAEEGAVAFSDDGLPVMDSGLMRRALEYARPLDRPIVVHEEDEGLARGFAMHEGAVASRLGLKGQPSVAEVAMLARDLMLVELCNGRLHVAHVSTAGAVQLVREARERGLRVTAEVTPHHLWLDHTSMLERPYDPDLKMAPPLRTEADRDALRAGVEDGTIAAIATDHAPHGIVDKEHAFGHCANGVVGLGSALGLTLRLVNEGALGLQRAVDALTHGAAACFGLEAGTLAPGRPADYVLVDPEARWALSTDTLGGVSRNSPFIGWEMHGAVRGTWVQGRRVYPAPDSA
jgi:dihydroorotase